MLIFCGLGSGFLVWRRVFSTLWFHVQGISFFIEDQRGDWGERMFRHSRLAFELGVLKTIWILEPWLCSLFVQRVQAKGFCNNALPSGFMIFDIGVKAPAKI